jgi:hypothetical protein
MITVFLMVIINFFSERFELGPKKSPYVHLGRSKSSSSGIVQHQPVPKSQYQNRPWPESRSGPETGSDLVPEHAQQGKEIQKKKNRKCRSILFQLLKDSA